MRFQIIDRLILAAMENGVVEDPYVIDQTNNYISENSGDFWGIGIFALLAMGGGLAFLNWKMNSTKKTRQRFGEYKESKATYAHQIKRNDEKQIDLIATLDEKSKLSKEKEVEIARIIDEAAENIRKSLQEEDTTAIVKRLRRADRWKVR